MGEALAAAIGIALSPFAIIPAVLLLFTVTPIKSALSFASGWFLGVGVVTVAAVLLADAMTLPDSPSREVSWLRVAVGVGLIVLGLEKFIRRGGAKKQPAWMSAMSTATPSKAFKTGVLLSLANPKVALLAIAGGFSIGAALNGTTAEVLASVGFAFVATIPALIPVVFYATMKDKALAPLQSLNSWLTKNSDVAVSVVLVVIGALLLVKGASSL